MGSDIKGRVHKVHVLLIELFPEKLHRLAEALEVNHLTLPQELDYIVDIRVIRQTQNVVIGDPCFLFWCVVKNTTATQGFFGNKRVLVTVN